jgi:hypothetical protein
MPAHMQDSCSQPQTLQVPTLSHKHITHSQTTPDAEQVLLSPVAQEHSPSWQEAPQMHGSQAQPPSESQAQDSLEAQLQGAFTAPQAQAVQAQLVQSHCSVQEHSLQLQSASIWFGVVLMMVFISRFSLLSC